MNKKDRPINRIVTQDVEGDRRCLSNLVSSVWLFIDADLKVGGPPLATRPELEALVEHGLARVVDALRVVARLVRVRLFQKEKQNREEFSFL